MCLAPMLAEAGLTARDLLDQRNRARFQPVLSKLVRMAVEHLDQGWLYAMAIPRSETRLRLSCMWPILSAGESLKLVMNSPDLLNPAVESENPSEPGLPDHSAHDLSPAPAATWALPTGAALRKQIV